MGGTLTERDMLTYSCRRCGMGVDNSNGKGLYYNGNCSLCANLTDAQLIREMADKITALRRELYEAREHLHYLARERPRPPCIT